MRGKKKSQQKGWQGLFNHLNEMELNPAILREWTCEIEQSQRGCATIFVTQEEPEAKVPAEHVST
ncbi:hypothetical protein VP01_2905g5 [Puccinia sorghi]|uniref:Uncharacterized protein n=1 Tax=Puccinia sorghi TaxID=27349 RepID=A0A0L6V1H1_9BASI|nr:hypothetical protein VP01_2905g5 [Puccinia sorghi]